MLNIFGNKFESISTWQLNDKLRENEPIKLLDVRTEEEYQRGHIPQAINVPLNSIENYQGNKNDTLFVICHSGMRSQKAANRLTKMGYKVTNVNGGMTSWSGSVKGGK